MPGIEQGSPCLQGFGEARKKKGMIHGLDYPTVWKAIPFLDIEVVVSPQPEGNWLSEYRKRLEEYGHHFPNY
jgi:hypothetical protein